MFGVRRTRMMIRLSRNTVAHFGSAAPTEESDVTRQALNLGRVQNEDIETGTSPAERSIDFVIGGRKQWNEGLLKKRGGIRLWPSIDKDFFLGVKPIDEKIADVIRVENGADAACDRGGTSIRLSFPPPNLIRVYRGRSTAPDAPQKTRRQSPTITSGPVAASRNRRSALPRRRLPKWGSAASAMKPKIAMAR